MRLKQLSGVSQNRLNEANEKGRDANTARWLW